MFADLSHFPVQHERRRGTSPMYNISAHAKSAICMFPELRKDTLVLIFAISQVSCVKSSFSLLDQIWSPCMKSPSTCTLYPFPGPFFANIRHSQPGNSLKPVQVIDRHCPESALVMLIRKSSLGSELDQNYQPIRTSFWWKFLIAAWDEKVP